MLPDSIIVPHPDAPPEAGAGGGGSEEEPISILQQMIQLAQQYQQVEPDEEDKAKIVGVMKMIQDLLAKDQNDKASALGNPAIQRVLRKNG
jgi:hypothetical protein